VPADLRKQSMGLLALYIACGLDPEKNILFMQSHVSEHAELAWVLNCSTYMGELNRMTQFKEKAAKNNENINTGLFSYPVLMASDILLYQTDLVPVGQDQKQHLELTRDVAMRFNNAYSETFKVPEAYIGDVGARVMSLQNPTAKMSKSDSNVNGFVSMLDEPDVVVKKFKRAVTDSDAIVQYNPETKLGVSNLMSIYSCITGESFQAIEESFSNKGYGDFKLAVGEATADMLQPIQTEYKRLMQDKQYLNSVLVSGAERAERIAARTLQKVYKKVGFVPRG
jgi:tryptophanyl-tRNA synthetase